MIEESYYGPIFLTFISTRFLTPEQFGLLNKFLENLMEAALLGRIRDIDDVMAMFASTFFMS